LPQGVGVLPIGLMLLKYPNETIPLIHPAEGPSRPKKMTFYSMLHPKIVHIALAMAMTAFFAYQILTKTAAEVVVSQMVHVFLFMFSTVAMVGVITSDPPLTNPPKQKLDKCEYDMDEVVGPRLDGILLRIASYLLSHGWIGHFGRRPVINLNGLQGLRELGSQAALQNYPIVFYPFRRNTKRKVNDNTAMKAIQKGISRSYDSSQVVGVLDYHQAYSEKKVTPSLMMARVFGAIERVRELCHVGTNS
jgi:hypothetical protein